MSNKLCALDPQWTNKSCVDDLRTRLYTLHPKATNQQVDCMLAGMMDVFTPAQILVEVLDPKIHEAYTTIVDKCIQYYTTTPQPYFTTSHPLTTFHPMTTTPHPGGGSTDYTVYYIIGAVVVLIIIIAIVLMGKNKRRR